MIISIFVLVVSLNSLNTHGNIVNMLVCCYGCVDGVVGVSDIYVAHVYTPSVHNYMVCMLFKVQL